MRFRGGFVSAMDSRTDLATIFHKFCNEIATENG